MYEISIVNRFIQEYLLQEANGSPNYFLKFQPVGLSVARFAM
uniref:Uncharacterized protein n=1 Tax=viral metagenome TaxID=1070528 RepID=A0A6C0AD36_9ZZZZ